ncbi:MAG: hypothetical protein KGI27_07275 [Thaumarchaeota archaeon]|nr:hypothetical protein [Nitrososphaerota archaeon]
MKKINKTKTIVTLHLIAVVVAAGIAMMAEDKVFAQPVTQNNANSQVADQPDQPDSQNNQANNIDNHSDGETNDDNNTSSRDSIGDGDGEHQD